MNPIFLTISALLIGAQLTLPKRFAFAPLLVAACFIGNVEFVGEFTIHRLLITLGLARAALSGCLRFSASNPLDLLFILFAVVAMATATAHGDAGFNFYVSNLGLILNVCGTYFYGRAFLWDDGWPEKLATVTAVVMLPLGALMMIENSTAKNPFAVLGTTTEGVNIREGDVRARGPFLHPILAGTAGAVSFPFCFINWKSRRTLALAGMLGSGSAVFASGSSGPMAALFATATLLWFWRKRHLIPQAKIAVVLGIVFLHFYMERPFYYIMDSIDLAGGSTGWHRARLIEMAIEHLDEWWLAGTDITRHWMPTGVSWNPKHTDITNYYLHLGVIGGLPLMLSLIGIIFVGFRNLLNHIGIVPGEEKPHEFALWCLGAALFGHALSFVSISYFDQMYVLFYLLVGGIGGIVAITSSTDEEGVEIEKEREQEPGAVI